LHPQDEGSQGDGNSGEPLANQAAPGLFAVIARIMSEHDPYHLDEPPDCVTMEKPHPADPMPHPASQGDRAAAGKRTPSAVNQFGNHDSDQRAAEVTTIPLSRIGEEVVAWLKTLTSAAVYATLIVTFGFQVARVEGQSMAPTIEDQDRLIVNNLA